MKLTQFLLPVKKEDPSDASVISHKLMLRAGLIHKQSSGLYCWLPLGTRVLHKVCEIIRYHMEEAGVNETIMPCIQPADLWRESGRYDGYGKEMLRMQDRHENDMLFSPTNEEVATDIFRNHVNSYKSLPTNIYQIQWKFRDEIRPRFGVMRAREFLMKDAYSFDIDANSARKTYFKYLQAYLNIFKEIGVTAMAVKADNGVIGGDLSHEFHIVAENGESELFYEKEYLEYLQKDNINLDKVMGFYSATDEKHKPEECKISEEKLQKKRGIEVGHIFNFGDKYSKSMNALITNEKGERIHPNMGSYGIGVSRVVAAVIEASHDEKGIIWPEAIAPFDVIIVNLNVKSEECNEVSSEIYDMLKEMYVEVLLDDTNESLGSKLATADLIGIPYQIIVGPKSLANDEVEVKIRSTSEIVKVKLEDLEETLSDLL